MKKVIQVPDERYLRASEIEGHELVSISLQSFSKMKLIKVLPNTFLIADNVFQRFHYHETN